MPQNYPTKDWSAWRNMMPPGPHSLHVIGTVTCPTPGFTARLVPHKPQGINPAIYLFDLVVTPPTGPVTEVITDVHVHYSEITNVAYTDVTILPGNTTVPVRMVF